MFKKLLQLKTLLVALLVMTGAGNVWGEEEVTYTFTSMSWEATRDNTQEENWTKGKGGERLAQGQGIQVTTSASGANGTSPVSYSNISKIVVKYCTNAKKGEGTIKVKVGDGTEKSFTVSKPSSDGTTLKDATFDFSPVETGKVKVTVDCTANSVYIHSVTITYSSGSTTETCATPTISPATGTYTSAQNVTISTETTGATIYYTTDGTDPTTSSIVYTEAIPVSTTTTIKAMAAKEGMTDSSIATAVYTIQYPLFSIALSGTYPTTFLEGAAFSHEGMTVTATYSDASTKDVTSEATFSGYNMSTTGVQTVTVSYTEGGVTKTATYGITVNEAPSHNVTWSVNGETTTESYKEGAVIEFPKNLAEVNGKTFVGWTTNTIDGTTAIAPEFVTSAEMGNGDVTYYAVFAKASMDNVGWKEVELSNMSASDVFVFSTGSYAIPNDKGTSEAPNATSITVTGDKITSDVPDNLKWNVSGNATDGYTFYPNGSTTTWLYCNTTASSKSNDNIRVGTGNRKSWVFNNSGYLVTNDTYTIRYLSLYNWQDFRGYTSDSNGAFVPKFYKYVEASYSDYCTTVAAPVVAAPVADKESGEYAYGTTVTLTQDAAAMIVYTIDGTTPSYENSVGTEYNAPIAITSDFTLKAIAVDDDGNESPVAAWEYAVTRPIAPTFSLDEGLYSSVQTLTISANDKICYKVNNGEFEETNTTSVTLRLKETQTITAYAKDANGLVSDEVSRTYKIEIPSVGLVTFNFDAENVGSLFNFGTDSYLQENSLSCSKGGVTLTVNKEEAGTEPRIDGPSNSAHHLRIYTNNTLSFTAPVGYRISDVAFDFSEGSLTCDETTYSTKNATWSGLAQEITFVGKEKAFIDAINVTLVEVVNVSAAGYATFSSTNALDFTDVEGICAYTATVEKEAISFTRVNKVPANTGVLLRSVEGGAVEEAVPSLTGAADGVNGNLFVAVSEDIASLASEDANNNYYILNNGSNGVGFYLANDKKVGAGKAYLAVPKTAGVRGFISFDFSDPATGIATIGGNAIEGTAFDLQGRRVSMPKNGLYIINGKKVIVK